MGSTEEFIGLYHRLWDYLRETTDSDDSTDFDELVDKAAKMNGVFKNEAGRIKDFGKLGNTIRNHNFYQIAEPTEKAVSEFKRLVDNIISPKNLIPTFQVKIKCFTSKDKLVTALRYMQDNDFSQVVIKENGKLSLLTAEGVAKWLEQQADKDVITVADVKVGEALACDLPDTFEVMGPDDTIYDAQQAFKNSIDKKRPRLFAVIIADNGKRNGKPLGIVTPWDLTPAEAPSEHYVFRKQEDFWNIVFEGKSLLLKDNKGLRYIAFLIDHAKKPFHVLDLVLEVEGIPADRVDRGRRSKVKGPPRDFEGESRHLSEKTENPSTGSQKHADEVLDYKARKDFEKRLIWLAEQLDEAKTFNDSYKITKLKEKRDRIQEELRKAYGFGGKSREFSDPGEKARKSVQAAVSRTLKRIQKEHRDLWSHLYNSIRTGYWCLYDPSEYIEWSL